MQQGIPHAQLDGQNADLRVVCVGGRVVATIFRLSPHPITNLHLGGRRGDWHRCREAIPTRYWLAALDTAWIKGTFGYFGFTNRRLEVLNGATGSARRRAALLERAHTAGRCLAPPA